MNGLKEPDHTPPPLLSHPPFSSFFYAPVCICITVPHTHTHTLLLLISARGRVNTVLLLLDVSRSVHKDPAGHELCLTTSTCTAVCWLESGMKSRTDLGRRVKRTRQRQLSRRRPADGADDRPERLCCKQDVYLCDRSAVDLTSAD